VSYLYFIVSQYDNLPDYTAFVHAAKEQWHNDLFGPETARVLKNLRLDSVDKHGYLNFRCTLVDGCPLSVLPNNPSPTDIKNHDMRAFFAQMYGEIFATEDVPDHIGHQCCAQFAVSRAQILKRPKEDYQRMLDWAANTTLLDGPGVGWVFEKLWHIVFGMEPVQ